MSEKIVFFDLDGTLLDNEKSILESTKIAIRQLRERNIVPAVATGRPPSRIQWVLEELKIETYVTINGQYVVHEGKEVVKETFSREFLDDITSFAASNKDPLVYSSLDDLRSSVGDNYYVRDVFEPAKMIYPIVDSNYYHDNTIYKLMLFCESPDEEAYKQRYTDMYFPRWHKYALDVMPAGITKGTGIAKFLEVTGIKKENTFAFGDDKNDMEMFAAVGTSVAMGNAVAELKEISDLVTSSNSEDGIINGLKQLNLI
ncbi:Cof-type HAD-IIB family hydrolase [Niallia sp. JL1B1071]|uniref:Cof-type HAD-IIB family hydrolase n=1 Tax=Niallia tiangongensis TaxID=3237105 RepID=UPI0037DD3C3C